MDEIIILCDISDACLHDKRKEALNDTVLCENVLSKKFQWRLTFYKWNDIPTATYITDKKKFNGLPSFITFFVH